jgi:hypothetical protein
MARKLVGSALLEPEPMMSFKSKPFAGLLAMLAGSLGAHRLYLVLPYWWMYLLGIPFWVMAFQFRHWYQHPAFFVAMVPVIAGMLEAIIICLTPDAKWDERFNPGSSRKSANRWPPILVAIASLVVGTILMVTTLVLMFQTYFELQAGHL